MTRAAVAVLLVIAAASGAAAQEASVTVRGTVTDAQGSPLPDVGIEVLGSGARTVSGPDGSYRLEAPPGQRWIQARRGGFTPIRRSATLVAGSAREIPFELEPLPGKVGELTLLTQSGMSRDTYQDFQLRMGSAFSDFLTHDDIAALAPKDMVELVREFMPHKSRWALEQRVGGGGAGRLVRRTAVGRYGSVGPAASSLRTYGPDCPPVLSVNGNQPWPGLSVADFDLADVEALEIYRRGAGRPTEFASQDAIGCGMVVVWLR